MEKPKKPVEPNWRDYPTPTESNGENYLGKPLYTKLDYVKDLEKYYKDYTKYQEDMEIYEQLKFIKLIKNATEKYCLKTFKIIKLKT
jgi:hypothetical protein